MNLGIGLAIFPRKWPPHITNLGKNDFALKFSLACAENVPVFSRSMNFFFLTCEFVLVDFGCKSLMTQVFTRLAFVIYSSNRGRIMCWTEYDIRHTTYDIRPCRAF